MNDREFIDWQLERAIDELHDARDAFPHMKAGVHLSQARGTLEHLFDQREFVLCVTKHYTESLQRSVKWEEDVDPFIVGLIGHGMSQLSRAENLLRNDDGDEQQAVFRAAMCVGRAMERLEIAQEELE